MQDEHLLPINARQGAGNLQFITGRFMIMKKI